MKKSELLFNTLSLPTDIIALILAGLVAYHVRYNIEQYSWLENIVGPIIFNLEPQDFLNILIKTIPVLLVIFAFLGLYKLSGTRSFSYQLSKIILGTSIAALATVILFFFDQSIFPSRFIILAAWLFSMTFVSLGRLVLRTIQHILFTKNYGLHKLIIIDGQGSESQLIQTLFQKKQFGYQIVAKFNNSPNLLTELETFIDHNPVDEIIQTNPELTSHQNLQLASLSRSKGLNFSFIPSLLDVQRNVVELNNFQGIPVISLKNTPLDGWGRVVKRIFDLGLSFIALIVCLPFFFLIALAIKINSSGPILYKANRCGKQQAFTFYKFRSMYTHLSVGEKYGNQQANEILQSLLKNEQIDKRNGPLHKIKDDPRVTKVGQFLRKTKLDELPQFINVLKGNMSLVGPRPHLPEQVEIYKRGNERIFSIKPGIFGLTQLAQLNWPTLPFEEEIKLDTYYIENWTWRLDLLILLKSFILVIFGKKHNDNY